MIERAQILDWTLKLQRSYDFSHIFYRTSWQNPTRLTWRTRKLIAEYVTCTVYTMTIIFNQNLWETLSLPSLLMLLLLQVCLKAIFSALIPTNTGKMSVSCNYNHFKVILWIHSQHDTVKWVYCKRHWNGILFIPESVENRGNTPMLFKDCFIREFPSALKTIRKKAVEFSTSVISA